MRRLPLPARSCSSWRSARGSCRLDVPPGLIRSRRCERNKKKASVTLRTGRTAPAEGEMTCLGPLTSENAKFVVRVQEPEKGTGSLFLLVLYRRHKVRRDRELADVIDRRAVFAGLEPA